MISSSAVARHPSVGMAVLFATGIVMQRNLQLPLNWLVFGALLVLSGTILFSRLERSSNFYLVGLSLLVVGAGALRMGLWQEENLNHPLLNYLPLQAEAVFARVATPTEAGKKQWVVQVDSVRVNSRVLEVNRRFLLRGKEEMPPLLPGDRLELRHIRLEMFPPVRNPGQFDYGGYLRSRGITGLLRWREGETELLRSPGGFSLPRLFGQVRNALERRIHSLLPGEAGGFFAAIFLGRRGNLDPGVRRDFQNTGVAHVLAISGLHVGFIVLVVYLLLSFLPLSLVWRNMLTVAILLFYMFLTGNSPSVVRATLMTTIYLTGEVLERKQHVVNTLFATALLILLFAPHQLFWIGFQYSFAAVFSILLFYPRFRVWEQKLVRQISSPKTGSILRWVVLTPFGVSAAAQLGTIPITMYYFQKISFISFFLNLLVIPLVGFILITGIALLGFSLLALDSNFFLPELLGDLVQGLFHLVHASAQIPLAYLELPRVNTPYLLLYLLACLIFLFWSRQSFRSWRWKAGLGVLLLGLLVSLPGPSQTEILCLDVGQGDAVLLHTPGNRWILVDAGPAGPRWDSGERVVGPALQFLGTLHLDKLFITHFHNDHVGGVFSLLDRIQIDSVYFPAIAYPDRAKLRLLKALQKRGIPWRALQFGTRLVVDPWSRIYVLAPFPRFLHPRRLNGQAVNNTSLVLLLKIRRENILLTGDIEVPVEQCLVGWGKLLRTRILKVPHHGSITSSSSAFLNQVNPQFALIPVGRRNKFGHPSPTVLQRLKQHHIHYFRTDSLGAIWMRFRGQRWQLYRWRK